MVVVLFSAVLCGRCWPRQCSSAINGDGAFLSVLLPLQRTQLLRSGASSPLTAAAAAAAVASTFFKAVKHSTAAADDSGDGNGGYHGQQQWYSFHTHSYHWSTTLILGASALMALHLSCVAQQHLSTLTGDLAPNAGSAINFAYAGICLEQGNI